ncbi:MAG: CYTH domain-containing protein [Gemmatimonadota bacterium]|jgi:hypothetical protein
MSPIERETKLEVTREDYQKILASGDLRETRDQLNIYLHDPGRLGDEFGYFRVRLEAGGSATATLKVPVGWEGEVREMLEVERPLSELGPGLFPRPRRWVSLESSASEGLTEHFQGLGITRLRRLGWMRNLRHVVYWAGIGSVELDRTLLPNGGVHYEVEIDDPRKEVHQALVRKIREVAPSATFTRVGKFSRFLWAVGMR